MLIVLLILAVCFVAFVNGANDNFKGVASLYGSGTLSLRQTLYWGTAATLAGSIAAVVMGEGLVKQFGGRGIVPDAFVKAPDFLTAVAIGAASTVWLATRCGFPISTTHALMGSLTGAGLAASPSELQWTPLGKNSVLPLLCSPLIAAVFGASWYGLMRLLRLAPDHRTKTLDAVHFLTTGAASFARGLNDTPKIVGLLVIVPELGLRWSIVLVAVSMALGGLLAADRVAETMGKKLTSMTPGQGCAVSFVTACLVITASWNSLPVSTTHVSVGSLLGMGASTHQAKWHKVFEILLAWVITAPCGALIAALSFFVLRQFASNSV